MHVALGPPFGIRPRLPLERAPGRPGIGPGSRRNGSPAAIGIDPRVTSEYALRCPFVARRLIWPAARRPSPNMGPGAEHSPLDERYGREERPRSAECRSGPARSAQRNKAASADPGS